MKITINGTETDYDDPTIGYDDIAAFVAIEEQWHPPLPLLSITYSWKGEDDQRRDGIISPKSQPIKPAPGMNISAYHTGSA